MADPSNYASVIVSETLQKKFRDTFPAQAGQGLGGDLLASGVVVPTIDFGSVTQSGGLSESLQQALNFGGNTSFVVSGSSSTIATNPGFYRVVGVSAGLNGTSETSNKINISDGSTTKTMWSHFFDGNTSIFTLINVPFDYIFYLATGESMIVVSSHQALYLSGSIRQIATSDGTLVLPLGFSSG